MEVLKNWHFVMKPANTFDRMGANEVCHSKIKASPFKDDKLRKAEPHVLYKEIEFDRNQIKLKFNNFGSATIIVFESSRKINLLGLANLQEAITALNLFVFWLYQQGVKLEHDLIYPSNIVQPIYLGHAVDLAKLAVHEDYANMCTYTPENFQAVVFYPDRDSKATVNIFESGRCNLMGINTEKEVEYYTRYIREVCGKFVLKQTWAAFTKENGGQTQQKRIEAHELELELSKNRRKQKDESILNILKRRRT